MTEQLSEINLSEEQSGACALPMHLDQSVNCKGGCCYTCSVQYSAVTKLKILISTNIITGSTSIIY